jgi:hypothetical protein
MTEINENGEIKCDTCNNEGMTPLYTIHRVCPSCQGTRLYWIDELMNKQKHHPEEFDSMHIGINPIASKYDYYIRGISKKDVEVKQKNIEELYAMARELFYNSIYMSPFVLYRRSESSILIDLGEFEMTVKRKDPYDRSRR